MERQTDRELVQAAKEGDSHAFGLFVRRHQKRVYRLALHLLRDPAAAEDATQDAFVRAYGALDRFDGRSEPFTWLYRITVNLTLNLIRANRHSRRAVHAEDPRVEAVLIERRPGYSDPSRQVADRRLATDLCAAIDSLSDTLRTTLILVAIDGLTHADAGRVLGCPEGTVAWRVHEARKKVRAFLDGRGYATLLEDEP